MAALWAESRGVRSFGGEIQGPGLGMAVQVYDPDGQAVLNEMGELVCEQAFPSMPLGFWGTMRGNPNTEARISRSSLGCGITATS